MTKIMTKKTKGVSVQSIIIGSIILGVIAGAGIAAMWPSVEKAKVVSEKSTIGEMQIALQGLMQDYEGGFSTVDATVQADMKARVASLPTDLVYNLAYAENTTTGDYAIGLVAGAHTTGAIARLKNIAAELDAQIDGGDGATSGSFQYDLTCAAATTGTDCYYSVFMVNGGITSANFSANVPSMIDSNASATPAEDLGTTWSGYNVSWAAINK
jgi:hypothetical protein